LPNNRFRKRKKKPKEINLKGNTNFTISSMFEKPEMAITFYERDTINKLIYS
jgi:hypothetical protein